MEVSLELEIVAKLSTTHSGLPTSVASSIFSKSAKLKLLGFDTTQTEC